MPKEGDLICFGEALAHMKNSGRVCRKGWTSEGVYIYALGDPVRSGKCSCFYMGFTAKHPDDVSGQDWRNIGYLPLPWMASHVDIMAEDWLILDQPIM